MARTRLRSAASLDGGARRRFQEKAGLDGDHLAALADETDALPGSGWCAGAVVLAGRGPYVALEHATGWALRYASYDPGTGRGVELPADQWLPMRTDTVFDLASLTKLFTAIATVQQAERGALDLDAPAVLHTDPRVGLVTDHGITVRHLLAHTSGLRAELPLYEHNTAEHTALLLVRETADRTRQHLPVLRPQPAAARTGPVARERDSPSTRSSARASPNRWAWTAPASTRRAPGGPAPPRPRTSANPGPSSTGAWCTGRVHDENAYAMAGVAGHAGLFSTARDLAILCRTLLSGGAYGPARTSPLVRDLTLLAPPGLGFQTGWPNGSWASWRARPGAPRGTPASPAPAWCSTR